MPNTLPPGQEGAAAAAFSCGWWCFVQARPPRLAAQPGWGRAKISSTTDDTFGQKPRKVSARHHLCRDASRQLSRGGRDGGCSVSGYSRLRLDIKFYSWSPLGPCLEYLSSCKEPLQVLLPGCSWNYSRSFRLNLSFTKVERPSETQNCTSSSHLTKHLST